MWGCFLKGIGIFLAMAVIALILDGIEWMFEHWWIILIIAVIPLIVRTIRRPAHAKGSVQRGVSFRRLIKAAASDGVVTEKERQAIIRKGVQSGMSEAEAEIMMEAKLHKMGIESKKKRQRKTSKEK